METEKQPRLFVHYFVMLAVAVGVFLVVRHYGEGLPAGATGDRPPLTVTIHQSDWLYHLLLALLAVVLTGRIIGKLFQYLGQPPVIGEVLAGIVLGPSVLGRIDAGLADHLLPQSVAPLLGVVAQLGVILYMFIVGLELDTGWLRGRGKATVAISHASIVAPFTLGACLALVLYPRLAESHVTFTLFALFMGVAMSITAFPVLARILTDQGLARTPLGVIALTCAATDDVSAWCLLAILVGVAQAQIDQALLVVFMAMAFIGVMFLIVRPLIIAWCRRFDGGRVPRGVLAIVFIGLLGSALMTEWIGIHAIFGAFLLGAIFPHDSAIARDLTHKLEDLVTIVLLPAFFAFTGMRTQIGLVSGAENWLLCGLIILVATVGKFGGTVAAARLTNLGWRDASRLGILMNTRGLMELIVLNIGLDLRIISPTVFAMMVLMALATTIATTPILRMLSPRDGGGTDLGRATT